MEGQRASRVNPALVGLLAAVMMFGLLIVAFANIQPFAKHLVIRAQVTSSDTLANAADVQVAGVKVGAVDKVEKGDPGALVTMTIDASMASIYRDASVQIRPHGVFGPKFIQIDPGNASAGAFQSGQTIEVLNSSVSVDFEQVLNELDGDTRTALKTVFYELGRGSTDRGEDVGRIIDGLNVVTAQLPAPLQVITRRTAETGRMFESNAVITETLAAAPLDSLVRENGDVLAKLDARRGSVTGLVQHGNAVLADLDVITAGDNVNALKAAIAQLPTLMDRLIHFSNGFGYAGRQLQSVVVPSNGQADGDIGLAIRRTTDAFGECDMTSQPGADTVHAIVTKVVPCYKAASDGPAHPYGVPNTDAAGHVAHHHVKILFGLHLNGVPGQAATQLGTEEEGRTVCGPNSSDATRGSSPAFRCFNDSGINGQSSVIPGAPGVRPPDYSASAQSQFIGGNMFVPSALISLFDLLSGN